jgi:hypothetical protein
MLTTTNSNIVTGIDPNLLKLSDESFSINKIQYNTNYLIFLDKNEIIKQFHLYEKHKSDVEEYLIKEKINILGNFNKVLQNYKKSKF